MRFLCSVQRRKENRLHDNALTLFDPRGRIRVYWSWGRAPRLVHIGGASRGRHWGRGTPMSKAFRGHSVQAQFGCACFPPALPGCSAIAGCGGVVVCPRWAGCCGSVWRGAPDWCRPRHGGDCLWRPAVGSLDGLKPSLMSSRDPK